MFNFTISLPDYSTTFKRTISIPVEEDSTMPLSTSLRNTLAPGTDFDFQLDDAITAADRYLAIQGNPKNPAQIVEQWINALRWEVSTYWESPGGNWYDVREGGPIAFTSEHPKRAGEMLAQGIAILFLEKRLKLSRSRFFFLEGSEARPDFLIYPERSAQRVLLLKNRSKMGLEVRSRWRVQSVPSTDKVQLYKKKQALSGTLVIYCAYGRPTEIRGAQRTHLILADPPGESHPASDAEVAKILMNHYNGVLRRLGVWEHLDATHAALEEIKRGGSPKRRAVRLPTTLPSESFNGNQYVGRFFSDLVSRQDRGELTTEEADLAIRTGRLGSVFYAGIRSDVLSAVSSFDIPFLEAFFDPAVLSEQHPSQRPVSDGTIRVEQQAVTPDSLFGDAIISRLRSGQRG